LGCNNIHQADLVGPRYIKNDGRFFSLNIMDLYSHRIFLHPQRTKDDQAVAQGLIRCWKTMGMPDFLQFDNELAFRGSNRYPRSFGIVLKLCLSLGIEAVFIPIGEPWRNGTIESFNDTYDQPLLPPRFKFPKFSAIPDGNISLIRFIRSDRILDVFEEHFEVPRDLVYTYVWATVITPLHQIQVYSDVPGYGRAC
jgi:hypothetical protein